MREGKKYVVTPASYHDIEGLKIMASEIKGGKVIGDKAYNSQRLYEEFEEKGVKLLAIPKKKRNGEELNPADLSEKEVKEIKSKRMVIETVFSALTRMGIKKLFAVSLKGLLSKISYIILAYSISKLINLKPAI
ncbi:MAG: transposase [Aquificaceae bacterium]